MADIEKYELRNEKKRIKKRDFKKERGKVSELQKD